MLRGCIVSVLAGLLLASIWVPPLSHAGNFLKKRAAREQGRAAGQVEGPAGYVAGPPSPLRYPGPHTATSGWYGYGFGVPTYSWGYFGAQYRPAVVHHHGYYGDFTQSSYRQGY